MMTVNIERSQSKKWMFCLGIAIIAGCIFYTPDALQWNTFWPLTFFAIALFALELIPNAIVATLLMLSYVTFSVAPPSVVFVSWTGFLPWLIFSTLCIDALVEKTGLANRVALFVMNKVAKTPLFLFLAFLVAGYAMNTFIADMFPNVIVLGTFGLGICKALELRCDSKAATSIMLACYIAGSNTGTNFLPNNLGLVAMQMLGEQGFDLNWTEFFINNFTLSFSSTLVSLLILYFYSRSEIKEKMSVVRECIERDYKELPSISSAERTAFVLLMIAVLSIVLEPYHGLPDVFLMAFVLFLSFCPPFSLLNKDDFAKFNFGIVIFIAGCLSIGFTATHLGVPAWFAGKLLPMVENMDSAASMSTFAYIIAVLANFVLTPLAAASSLSAPLADLAMQMNISAKPVIYSFLLGLDQWLLPYEAAPALFLYATGYMRLKHIIILMSLRIIFLAGVVWLNTVTVWNMMGI